MNDARPAIDNLRPIDVEAPRQHSNNYTRLPREGSPGRMTHSTPLSTEQMMFGHSQVSPEDKQQEEELLRTLESLRGTREKPDEEMPQLLNELDQKSAKPSEKKIEKPPIIKKTTGETIANAVKKNPSTQRGFLMPLVDLVNGVSNTVWKLATSWIPMKQTGTGTA